MNEQSPACGRGAKQGKFMSGAQMSGSIFPGCKEEAAEVMAADLVSCDVVGEETSRKDLEEDR